MNSRMIHTRPKPSQSAAARRREGGFSLPAVLAMSVVVSLTLGSMFAALIPIYQKVSRFRYATTLRGLSEAGLDYALAQINSSSTYALPSTPVTVPTIVTGDSQASVVVTISQTTAPADSFLYDPNNPNAQWAIATSVATKAGAQKSVSCILQPILQYGNAGTNSVGNVQMPFAAWGGNRVELVGQAGVMSYNSADPRQYSDIGTLGAGNQVGTGSTQRGIAQGGSQYEFPNPISNQQVAEQATMSTYNASPVSQAPWCQIMGNIYSNGDDTGADSGYWPRGPQTGNANAWNDVFGTINGVVSGVPNGISAGGTVPATNNWSGGIVDSYSTYPQPSVPAAPTAPSGAINLGPITLKNGAILKIDPSAAVPSAPLGTINGTTVSIPPGNYITSGLTLLDTSQILVTQSAANTAMYIQGTSSGNNSAVVSFSNSSTVNMTGMPTNSGNGVNGFDMGGVSGYPGAPANGSQLAVKSNTMPTLQDAGSGNSCQQLQLYYGGTGNIYLMGDARMVVYAPSATINIGAQPLTNDANFYGSIVGAVSRVISGFSSGGGAFLHYDASLRPSTFIDPFNPPPAINFSSNTPTASVTGYRAVSWQES